MTLRDLNELIEQLKKSGFEKITVVKFTQLKELAKLNAKDCLYYGYGKAYWNNLGLNEKLSNEIWKQAKKELENY